MRGRPPCRVLLSAAHVGSAPCFRILEMNCSWDFAGGVANISGVQVNQGSGDHTKRPKQIQRVRQTAGRWGESPWTWRLLGRAWSTEESGQDAAGPPVGNGSQSQGGGVERRQVTSGECALHAWRLGAQPVQRSLEGRCMQPGHEDPGTRGPRGESLWGIRSGGREGRQGTGLGWLTGL